jgi:hypothetical protein
VGSAASPAGSAPVRADVQDRRRRSTDPRRFYRRASMTRTCPFDA